MKGVDPEAYENFASLCRQDYPEYELVFCVDADNGPIIEVLEKLRHNFPERSIRILFGSGRSAPNDKAAKLARLVSEARYEVLVINDSDVRTRPDYLRTVVAPLADPEVGAVTLPYISLGEQTFADQLQSVGMFSDFYPGVFVARQIDGVKLWGLRSRPPDRSWRDSEVTRSLRTVQGTICSSAGSYRNKAAGLSFSGMQ